MPVLSANGLPSIARRGEPGIPDKSGEYRLHSLNPGLYLIAVSDGQAFGLIDPFPAKLSPSVAFHPRALSPVGARLIRVEPGGEVHGVDVWVPDDRPACCRIAGRIEGLSFDATGQSVRLVIKEWAPELPSHLEVATTSIQSDGSFVFPHVPPGTYEIRGLVSPGLAMPARRVLPVLGQLTPAPVEVPSETRSRWFSYGLSVVDREISNLVVPSQEGSRVRGRLILSREVGNVDLRQFPVVAHSLDGWNLGELPAGRTERDGAFVVLPCRQGGTSFCLASRATEPPIRRCFRGDRSSAPVST
jgi:hypothetical protein